MTRIRSTSPGEAVARAHSMIGAAIHYQGKEHNGGRDPFAPDPASHWMNEMGARVATCDGEGFVAWCLGYDRYQPVEFPYWDGWINTDSALYEADHGGAWFERLSAPEPGCLLVYPSLRTHELQRVGHVGLVVEVTREGLVEVIHCSHGNDAGEGRAIQKTGDTVWRDTPGEPPKESRFLRYVKAAR